MNDNALFFPMASEETITDIVHDSWLQEQFGFQPLPDDYELPGLARLAGLSL